jgi:hypothetical protein
MTLSAEIRDFYTRAGPMTELGAHADAIAGLPRDLRALCQIVQGDLLHHHWAGAYDVQLTPEKALQQHLRPATATLDAIIATSGRPLDQRRDPVDRAVGICRHYSVLTSAILRAQGVPARARVGFGAYFNPGTFEDHWVVEYWNEAQGRWVLTDAQLDALQSKALKIDFDPLDVPRDRFIIAGDAWVQCRQGAADPAKYGIFDMRGLWFIAGNVLRDLAALNNVEMLPWDCWGIAPLPHQPVPDDQLGLFDQIAAATLDTDRRFGELRGLYRRDPRLTVSSQVFNAVLDRPETVAELAVEGVA